MKDIDRDIIMAIKHGTESAARQKEKVWSDMEKRLETEKMKEKRTRNRRNIWKSLAAVLLIGAVFLAATPSGRAAVGNLIDLFEPEKNIEWEMEGMPESGEYQLHTSDVTPAPDAEGNAVSYVIYMDESRYYTETVDGADRILPLDYPEDYPPVYMEIKQDTGRTPEEVAAELEPQVQAEYTELVIGPQAVTDPIDAIEINGYAAGYEWDTPVVRYYLIDNTLGGTFVVRMQYFLEAEEGHGARFNTMLSEFQIIPQQGAGSDDNGPGTVPESPAPDGGGSAAGPEGQQPDARGNGVNYTINIDGSHYALETKEGIDWIVPLNISEDLPAVYMAISQDTGRTPQEVAAALAGQLADSYEYVMDPEDVTYPLSAINIQARTGNEWNSEVVSYYLIDNTLGGTFIVEEHYFLEAEEGHGARFNTMLEEFEIVPLDE